eukprot:Transcript_30697.p1 GENE.Transcript_30697~~Transcript_30697.p1  ORF type:complete len:442 (-),score=170.45 Transcript_30697:72-1247(-)
MGGVDSLSPLINATALSHLMMASVSSGSSALTVPSSRRLGEVVLAVPPPPSPPSPPDGPGMNWVPIIIVLVLIYLAVMALVLASFYCWRQQQPRASEKTSLTGGSSSTASSSMPTAAPARPVYSDNRGAFYDSPYGPTGGPYGPSNPVMARVATGRSITPQQKMEFVRKLYSILSTQLLVTVLICVGMIAASFKSWNASELSTFGSGLMANAFALMLCIMITMCPLLCTLVYQKNSYPLNYILLGVFTILESLMLGLFCVLYYSAGYGMQILIAAILTCLIFVALTLFTFFSKLEFECMGPFLFAACLILFFWSIIYVVIASFSTVPSGFLMAFSLFGALLFCGFIIYDTNMIINHYGVDDFIVGAIQLYLDVCELFVYILMCGSLAGGNN